MQAVRIERIWEPENRTAVLIVTAAFTLVVAVVDWWTRPYVSLGFLYLFPIMLSAAFLPRWAIAALGLVCAILAESFSSLARSGVRLTFETLALAGCGLFVAELLRNRRVSLESQDRLRVLVETSPAAIVTLDERGFIELANQAAVNLMLPREGGLVGSPIAAYVPDLHHALRWEDAPQFRASMQCRGHCGNGETFMAEVWFSTYREGNAPKLAAIIGPVADETPADAAGSEGLWVVNANIALTTRELDVLGLLVQGCSNKEIAVRLGVSEGSVKNSLQQLFNKTGVRSRSQLVRVALENYRNRL